MLFVAFSAAGLLASEPPSASAAAEGEVAAEGKVASEPRILPNPSRAKPRPWARRTAAVPAALPFETPQRIYRIECRIVERGEDGKDLVLSQPTVATIAHQPSQVQIAQQTPIVTGTDPAVVGGPTPSIAVLTTGLTMVMKVAPEKDGRASFDVSIERSDIESVGVTKRDDGSARQSARVATHGTRVIDSIELAKKFVIGIDDKDPAKSKRRAEFVVAEVDAKQERK
jgi:hypothetical protein